MIVPSEEEPIQYIDDTEPDYTPVEHPYEPVYTLADHFSSDPSSLFSHQLDLSFSAQIMSQTRTRRIPPHPHRSHHIFQFPDHTDPALLVLV
ncbi:unnamed protein product [Lactuca virosa]|uniref:Uncharacterized protein n=1 Tax=Lactuca virosa TaxID=75947 RepID=A0AAU9MLG7_9ASTR|nr:unnamed protein product [Lactuca virosa]